MAEIWKSVVGWEGYYEVSDLGRVRSLDRIDTRGWRRRGRTLAPVTGNNGYPKLALCRGNKEYKWQLHLLVLTTFKGSRPLGMEARHLDGDKQNATLSNLAWGTPSQNGQDRILHGTQHRGSKSPGAKLTEQTVVALRAEAKTGVTQRKLAAKFHVSQQHVCDILSGRRWGWM